MFRCKTTPCSEKMKDLAMACVISCPCIFFIRCADNYVAVKHVLPSCGNNSHGGNLSMKWKMVGWGFSFLEELLDVEWNMVRGQES